MQFLAYVCCLQMADVCGLQIAYVCGCNWLMFFCFLLYIFLHNFAYEITLLIIMLCWTDHNFGGVLCVDGFIVLDVSI